MNILAMWVQPQALAKAPQGADSSLSLALWFLLMRSVTSTKWFNQQDWQHDYPQVNWRQPSPGDGVRMLLQTVWNCFFYAHFSIADWRLYRHWLLIKQTFSWLLRGAFWPLQLGVKWVDRVAERPVPKAKRWQQKNRIINTSLTLVLALLAALCLTVPFTWQAQAVFVLILMFLGGLINRIAGRLPNMLLIVLSLTASCRYIWWRYTSTINWDKELDLVLGLILLAAESYSWVIIVLGYVQNIWPLNRKPVPLPEDATTWPSIDLFIPTYNEDLEVVRATVVAALGVDWPKDKLNIYILDDGKRDSFEAFAKQFNVGYFRRPTNEHAKAGNINYALKHTKGEYVAIFDCDHIPTRAFFQVTMGAFLKDKKLALVQTPHHFFSPDPFEKNLSNFRDVPNEGNLFYGLVQDGNDTWDAAFFCGSCAVLKRAPLMEVGGIAVETVTEDAHTALKMHRLGYHSAYLKQPVSAGLATDSLSAHIGQRIRWARGMAQIFRLDNPILGKGLKWNQRVCYANAMLHFLSGIPRLIFLLAPLGFLLLDAYIIYAPAIALFLYVLPHMFHANITNSRIQGEYRHSFWGEIYETVLAWYIAVPTTVALFAPHKGSFNVTAKGGLIEGSFFDWAISRPFIILIFLNLSGAVWGIWRLFALPEGLVGSLVINLFWTLYNLLILGGALAVAAETKQVRASHRIAVDLPATVALDSGHLYAVRMLDFSFGGLRVSKPNGVLFGLGDKVNIVLQKVTETATFACEVTFVNEKFLGLKLLPMTVEKEIDYIQSTFTRADTWSVWQQAYEVDKPMASLSSVLVIGVTGYRSLYRFSPAVIRWPMLQLSNLVQWCWSYMPRIQITRG
ncbi:UDP-forming cellulose synthase catalytic subunit [Motilimonas pumila]|uniref:Cellulose synthase catalytic subunit [UDP-forming] n=1 Tax=Motilimonas pumila TaxID=2303987 RepID=A0A418YG62_9GAMM|nr:UDP-forming cellulose synthase catalytic subunit [Motilimonas pumila]RJG48402.1 UDP-forming cellulose synthase catalytic subunit [Motilimonas pumila]